jgi:hypothetical protein
MAKATVAFNIRRDQQHHSEMVLAKSKTYHGPASDCSPEEIMAEAPKPSVNALRAHAQMMSLFAVLGIPVSTAVVIDKDGVRVSLPINAQPDDQGEVA